MSQFSNDGETSSQQLCISVYGLWNMWNIKWLKRLSVKPTKKKELHKSNCDSNNVYTMLKRIRSLESGQIAFKQQTSRFNYKQRWAFVFVAKGMSHLCWKCIHCILIELQNQNVAKLESETGYSIAYPFWSVYIIQYTSKLNEVKR